MLSKNNISTRAYYRLSQSMCGPWKYTVICPLVWNLTWHIARVTHVNGISDVHYVFQFIKMQSKNDRFHTKSCAHVQSERKRERRANTEIIHCCVHVRFVSSQGEGLRTYVEKTQPTQAHNGAQHNKSSYGRKRNDINDNGRRKKKNQRQQCASNACALGSACARIFMMDTNGDGSDNGGKSMCIYALRAAHSSCTRLRNNWMGFCLKSYARPAWPDRAEPRHIQSSRLEEPRARALATELNKLCGLVRSVFGSVDRVNASTQTLMGISLG